ncbi:putative nucleotidyltransferase substrate binding domain-containing protein [Arcobacter cryaerophilus gv. pseudocryaerophilus]|uniref:Nucleotidyltransferase substrate binding domain-containing protein n=3 Tax=unclassified Arcobacter TaxID=2593671 RepID=A0AA96L497_9BACT|nr:putative nucleotidyltransferase substrate binding domain-containing protein [Aliarcobacter skirrowii]WNL27441.1 putative nucleotidyltransferase substrate binding domain-containing protein [Arcobacter sp. AZ-2023]WPD05404.1 putative nucleotidyltransferase substrate binding domain-containing protein [Arcobacter sp. DSM 115956]WPD07498.1 putative nucleotidyltransferase substrate binding domain-containing protein [Arcobacter sp. DSM 115955]MDX4050564.1 putative nucleotidyltransferase substrate b
MQEQKKFISNIHPFNNLNTFELDDLVEELDIVYFKANSIVQAQDSNPEFLYFVLKGLIQEINDDEVLSVYSKGEIFDSVSLIKNHSKNSFVAIEESICYALKKERFMELLSSNQQLENYFFQSISDKLNNNILNEKNKDMANIMIAKVKDAKVHKAVVVDTNKTIYEAATIIKQEKIPTLLLKDEDGEMYIVTDSDFRQKVILNRMDYDDLVVKIASKGLIYINEDDFLFNAQLQMAKHGLKRVVVKNDHDEIVGILDQISLSSFFATNTFAVSNQIINAETLEELKEASHSFIKIIKSLNAKGVKIEFISKLINQLNKKLLDKLYKILAPKELIGKSCLVVMGSEGRAEQILRTDQDNALIISDDCSISEEKLREFTHLFTETLVDFGFPRCEGNIMVSNPYWCRKQSDFKELIYEWVNSPSGDNFMNIAIFYDALCVSGDIEIIKELKNYLFKISSNSQSFYTNFARVINSFDVPLGFFDGFVFNSKDEKHKDEIDIKRGGIFIIVQGIRSLSIQNRVLNTNTIKRINSLKELKVLDDESAKELIMAFNILNSLKLKASLEKLDKKEKIDNFVNPNRLTIMEKDLLKDSFKIVNRLKKRLENHFKLNYV